MNIATWIEANAGTGKTSRLMDEIIVRFKGGTSFDRICAVTFTEKAANEMVERLRTRVVEMVQRGDAPPSALDRLNESFVGTIHAFCSRILRRYGNRLGLPPLFAVDSDNTIFQSLLDTRWDRFVGRHLKLRGDHEAYIREFGLQTLRQMAEKLAMRRHTFRPVESGDLEWLVADLQDTDRWNLDAKGWVLLILKALEDFPQSRDLLEVVLESGTLQENTAWKNAVQDLLRCRHAKLHACLSWLNRSFVNGLLEEYRSLGYLRFDDMILDTRDLLKSDLEARRDLKSRYDVMLVDEMQDTDPVQYEIFLYLCEKNGQERDFTFREVLDGSRKLALQEGKFFGVGDPKQSIYGFRSADIGAYEAVKGLLTREGVAVEPLTTNFRSCRNLISFSNRLAQRLFRPARAQDSQAAREFCAGRSIRDCVHLVEIHSDNAAEQHLRILAEANWVAARVHSLISDPANPRKPQHIGILLRKLTSAHLYVDALNARNIRVVIEGERFFYQSQEVIDFVNLLKCIVDDMDGLALAGALRSPLFGLTDQQLAAFFLDYRLHGNASRALKGLFPEDESGRKNALETFLSVIEDLRERMREWTPGGLLREVFARLPVLTVAGLAYGNARRELAPLNLLKIHKLALEADPRPEMSAYRFIRTLESYSKEAKQTGQEPMADEALPAVRIMSIHLSKGLDFPAVFVPLTDYGVGAPEDATIVKFDWKTDTAGIKINRFTEANYLRLKYGDPGRSDSGVRDDALLAQIEEEERRVLYVAATRAKEQIFFSYVPWTGKKKDTGAGRPLLELLSETLPLEIPEEERVTKEVSEPWLAAPPDLHEAPGPLAPVLDAWNKIDVAAHRSTRLQHLSASEEARPDEEDLVEKRIAEVEASQAQCIGLICHGVLQRIDYSQSAEFENLVAVKTAELANSFHEPDLEAAAAESVRILRAFFQSEAAQWLSRVEILGREVPLVLPNPEEGRIVSGKVDLLVCDGPNLYVIDFKTGKSIEAQTLETYRRQMDLYTRAIETAASGIPVRKRICLLRKSTFLDL